MIRHMIRHPTGARSGRSLRSVRVAIGLLLTAALVASSCASPTDRSETAVPPLTIDRTALDARAGGTPVLHLVAPHQGAQVTSPVEITIEVENYSLAAKGVSKDGEGHFHVVADTCVQPGEVIGDDHTHVGSGAASVSIDLEPGKHDLCLQLGDGVHTALAITEMLSIEVVD